MKQWKVVNYENMCFDVRYDTIEEVRNKFPNCKEIVEIPPSEYTQYISKIISMPECVYKRSYPARHNRNIVQEYEYKSNVVTMTIYFYIDTKDYVYYDYCEYIAYSPTATLTHNLRECIKPKGLYDRISVLNFSFDLLSYTRCGYGDKLPKPKELKGIKQIGSAKFIGRTSNPIFIKDNDVYIQCNDYFSPPMKVKPEDIGTPLCYRAEKYIDKKVSKEFDYPDSWGEIILKRKAWLCFRGLVSVLNMYNSHTAAVMCCREIQKYHGWKKELDIAWVDMFESVCKQVNNAKWKQEIN